MIRCECNGRVPGQFAQFGVRTLVDCIADGLVLAFRLIQVSAQLPRFWLLSNQQKIVAMTQRHETRERRPFAVLGGIDKADELTLRPERPRRAGRRSSAGRVESSAFSAAQRTRQARQRGSRCSIQPGS